LWCDRSREVFLPVNWSLGVEILLLVDCRYKIQISNEIDWPIIERTVGQQVRTIHNVLNGNIVVWTVAQNTGWSGNIINRSQQRRHDHHGDTTTIIVDNKQSIGHMCTDGQTTNWSDAQWIEWLFRLLGSGANYWFVGHRFLPKTTATMTWRARRYNDNHGRQQQDIESRSLKQTINRVHVGNHVTKFIARPVMQIDSRSDGEFCERAGRRQLLTINRMILTQYRQRSFLVSLAGEMKQSTGDFTTCGLNYVIQEGAGVRDAQALHDRRPRTKFGNTPFRDRMRQRDRYKTCVADRTLGVVMVLFFFIRSIWRE
jgi:hypothetical protein